MIEIIVTVILFITVQPDLHLSFIYTYVAYTNTKPVLKRSSVNHISSQSSANSPALFLKLMH